jgi:hypothetical protein
MDKRNSKKDKTKKKKKQSKAEETSSSVERLPVLPVKQSNIRQKK